MRARNASRSALVVLCNVSAMIEFSSEFRSDDASITRGGVFAVAFSDRWFPPKAIRVWRQIHPFERLALVLGLLLQAGFRDLHSETLRGVRRPQDDKYSSQREFSDPLFAVWGRKP